MQYMNELYFSIEIIQKMNPNELFQLKIGLFTID